MKVSIEDTKSLRRHSVDIDESASVAHLKLLIANMSLVPAGFVPNLVYQKRNLSDGDCVGGIGYSPDLSISLVCVEAAEASAAADRQLQPSQPSDANPPAAAQSAPASAAAAAGRSAAQTAAAVVLAAPALTAAIGNSTSAAAAPTVNFATEWLDENGCVCPKVVDYASQCPKGHPLAPLAGAGCGAAAQRVMCRVCHTSTEREHASQWLACSADGSCAGYAVCDGCVSALQQAPAAAAGGHDFPSLVCVPSRTQSCGMRVAFLTLLQGVAALYLLWLRSTLGECIGRLTVEQACQMIIKPRTSRSRGSLVSELLQHADTSQYVGEATWFVSHTWSNRLCDTLDAVLLFFEGREDAATAKVWFDVLVDGQLAIAGASKPSSWYMTTFRSCIGRIGRLLLVADKWNNPTALRRAW
jgi:hypothetical protein